MSSLNSWISIDFHFLNVIVLTTWEWIHQAVSWNGQNQWSCQGEYHLLELSGFCIDKVKNMPSDMWALLHAR